MTKQRRIDKVGIYVLDKMSPMKLDRALSIFREGGPIVYVTTYAGRVSLNDKRMIFGGIIGVHDKEVERLCSSVDHIIVVGAGEHLYREGPSYYVKKYGMASLKRYFSKIINASHDTFPIVNAPDEAPVRLCEMNDGLRGFDRPG